MSQDVEIKVDRSEPGTGGLEVGSLWTDCEGDLYVKGQNLYHAVGEGVWPPFYSLGEDDMTPLRSGDVVTIRVK